MLLDQQLKIEQSMADEAKLRLTHDNNKSSKRQAWSESKLGSEYTMQASIKFAKFVNDQYTSFISSTNQDEKGKLTGSNIRGLSLMVKSGIPAEIVSYLFTKALYNLMPLVHRKRLKRVTLCKKAGDMIHDEMRIRFFANEKNRKNLLKKLMATFDKRTYPREWRKRTIKNYFDAEKLNWSTWGDKEKLVVGYTLLIWFRDCTRLIDAPRTSKFVDPTSALLDHVQQTIKNKELDLMLYKPMTIKPIPWTDNNLFRGNYLTDKVKPYALVKGSGPRDVERMQKSDWSKIIPAINALAETPWRINTRMLDMLQWTLYERQGNVAGLPPANDIPLPPEPVGYRQDDEITKAHNKVCFLIHSENRENISKRLLVFATITVAQQFKGYKEIYFPHSLDSRGRAYPVPVFLQPQGPDYCKALLEFANGKSIESELHACWLAIAGANAYGKDKISLQERINWVQENQDELIFSIARDPKRDVRWQEASEPFQFLRFCFEWLAFNEYGFGYKSHMVVPVDATCSGLQHYSAMLRDEVGGRSVNLVPGLDRQDIYQDVADRAIELLMEEGSDEARNLIKFGIDRKTTKRQVMVVPYAGTFASCMNYTRDALNDKLKEGHQKLWSDEEHNSHVVKLAQAIWQAIQDVVLKGREAMEWLSGLAREYSKHVNTTSATSAYDKRMSWVTPDGFEAIHLRLDSKKHQLDTYLDGRLRLTYYKDIDALSPSDMALACAPNFVHSLDATLLRMSVMKALDIGIRDFAMVHDSFGVHASDMPVFLDQCVKPAFIEMYQRDILQDFADRLPSSMDIPPKPERGRLVLEDVQHSEFFFS